MKRPQLLVGDLVKRRYDILVPGAHKVGMIIDRDRNGFLDVLWGSKVECMWDDYDLTKLEQDI
jgi:hypothetical protein